MAENSTPSIQIDLNEFKLHLHLKNSSPLTLHFDSPSRKFYLSLIALVVIEMKKSGKIKSVPLQSHFDKLVLLNESIGGAAGSSTMTNLMHRIYTKWKNALPNLEEAPLFKVLGKIKGEAEGAIGKVYTFSEVEKDSWANLFEYQGSEENVRLKFAIDRLGVNLDDIVILFEGSSNKDAWEKFISSLNLKPESIERVSLEKMANLPLPEMPSIAVLPFVNISEDSKQSDEMTDKIITALTKIPDLVVIARNSTSVHKKKPVKVKQVSENLSIRYVRGERKQVTVLFTNVVGYITMSEELDPEEVYFLIDQVYEILTHKVNEYGGTVNEFTGGGVMALFGAPIAQEDAPQRAIRASLAIHREIVQFNEKMRREKSGLPPLKMRAGIHTGPVVVGAVGKDLRVTFTAIGDTVTLASRMEALAEPGTTYLTEDTFKLTEGLFRFEGLGEQEVKGKESPIRIYRAIAPSTSRTRFDVSAERGLTSFVGREREGELLIDAFERARDGRGQAVSIISEAGMGKSRLLYEFRKAVLNEDITFLEGKCLSFGRGVAYQPITDILKSNFDIREDDGDPVIRRKVTQGLQTISAEEGQGLPYLLELLSVRESGFDKIAMSPEGKKDKIIETIKKIILKGSEIRPLIVAIEDLHWIDRTSEDVLKYLLESIPGARVLLIITYRPEFVPTWGGRSYHNQLLLNRLSNQESLLMATRILGTEDLEGALEKVILEKTDGIPFFIEEFIKSLKDFGFIERKDATYCIAKELQTACIPSTIQDMILARVDALPEGAKELLQVGSLIEREFSYKLIKAAMHQPDEELLRRLSMLKDAELLYERGLFPDSSLIFKHALTREVVYDTLLEKKKKELHLDIGKAIEEVCKDILEEMPVVPAGHFEGGGDWEKAAHYFHLAQRRARGASAHTNSIAFSRKEIGCLEKLPQTIEVQKRVIDARVTLTRNCMMLARHDEARDALAPVVDLVLQLDYRERLPAIYSTLAIYLIEVEERHNEAETRWYLMEAQRYALKENDYMSLWFAYSTEGFAYGYDCEFEKGESCLLRCVKISEAHGYVTGMVWAKGNIANIIYTNNGSLEKALSCTQEALQLALQVDDLYLKGLAHWNCGNAFFRKGLFSEAEQNLKRAIEMCQKTDNFVILLNSARTLEQLYYEIGRYQEAQECGAGALTPAEGDKINPSYSRVWQLQKVANGVQRGLNPSLDTVLNFDLLEIRKKVAQGRAAYLMGKIYFYFDDNHMDQAEAWIRKAFEINEQNGMPWELARAYALYADFFKKKGDRPQAKEKLGRAIDLMRGCGADGWVERYEKELAILS